MGVRYYLSSKWNALKFDLDMTKEEAKEFGLNLLHGILARNEKSDPSYASLVREVIEALTESSLPSNFDEAIEKYLELPETLSANQWEDLMIYRAFKDGAEWIAEQGVSYQATISADKTIPVLPMKDVSDMGLDYGDKVIVQIRKIN